MESSFGRMDIFHGSHNGLTTDRANNPIMVSEVASMFNNFSINKIFTAFVNGTNVLFLRLLKYFV